MEKKLDGNYTRVWNKSWRQHPQSSRYTAINYPSRKLSKLDEPDMRDPAGEVGTSSLVIYSCWTVHMDKQRQDDQLEPTYSSSLPIRDVALKTYRKQWTIGRGGERGSWWWWYMYISLYHIHVLLCSVGWGCRIHWLLLCRGVRPPPPTSVLDMTLNNLIVRLQ